jgi:protein-tyrosine phosphatase
MKKILFVCLGNICRSPTAHGILQSKINALGLSGDIQIDSCGTGAWHVGQGPDERAVLAAAKRGYDLSALRARRLSSEDFQECDYILAMDARNLADIMKIMPKEFAGKLKLFLDYAQHFNMTEVPDPYHDGPDGFERVLDMLEAACDGLLIELQQWQ